MGFRRLATADKFIADAAKYKSWRALTTAARQTKYDALNVQKFTYNKQLIYVSPFGLEGYKVFVETKGPAASQNAPCPTLLTLLTGYYVTTAPVGPTISIIQPTLFPVSKLAKMTLKLRTATATTRSNSRITDAKYYRHTTNSASMPFGQTDAVEDYTDIVATIKGKADYKTFAATKGNSISFIPEG